MACGNPENTMDNIMRIAEARGLLVLGTCLLAGASASPPAEAAEPAPAKVRLAVLVVVDQLRGDMLLRWDRLFGDRGFRRLAREGAWHPNCYYPYASTFTGAGHASLATGCDPRVHGIIGNDWYDRNSGESLNAARSLDERTVPALPVKDPKAKPTGSGSPHFLLAPTVADMLKEATKGKGKVVAVSVKDRSAVLPGGKRPDACYWMDPKSGLFVTSTYYRASVHPWVDEFNRARPADRWFGKTWQRLRDDLDYDLHTGPDEMEGEGRGYKQGFAFPHPFADKLGEDYYEGVANSPFGNTLLLELAKKAIAAERLGKDDVPDLLTLSFSSNDLIGHTWGPDSHELLDATLRTDRDLMDLLKFLDVQVGKGQYAVVLSADHGVCPTPEVARLQGKLGGRTDPKLFLRRADDFLERKYGKSPVACTEALVNHDIYLGQTWLKAQKLNQEEVEKTVAAWATEQPEVMAAYTRTELLKGVAKGDALGEQVRRSFHPERSGDVTVILKPYHMFWSPFKLGTTHGAAHDYDRHVPLLAMGPGVRPGVNQEAVTPQAAAAILARFLGIQPPKSADAPLPASLFGRPE
jgi:predicted AlkP superfamily pyrophosphatase or phosphodiesterase